MEDLIQHVIYWGGISYTVALAVCWLGRRISEAAKNKEQGTYN